MEAQVQVEKLIQVELNDEGDDVRIRTFGWYNNQDLIMSRGEAWDWLMSVCDNGNAPPTRITVWNNDR